jgi:hypothetical protein
MYRIELSPGEETVFRSIEELAVAIKRGIVTPRARIYHNASNKWLPIQFHPHYRTALEMPLSQSALVAGPSAKPLSSLTLEPPGVDAPGQSPVSLPSSSDAEPTTKRKSRRSQQKSTGSKRPRSSGKPRRQLRIALVGALLLGGAQWVLSEPLFSRVEPATLFHTHREFLPAPANTAAMIPVIETSDPAASAASFGGAGTNRGLPVPPRSEPGVESAVADSIEPPPTDLGMAGSPVPLPDSIAAKPKVSPAGVKQKRSQRRP